MFDEATVGGLGRKDLKTLLEEYERSLLQAALSASRGNQRRAAAALGVLPTTLHEKLKRLGLRGRPLPSSDAEVHEPAERLA